MMMEGSAMSNMPQIMANNEKKRPKKVTGNTSPYPLKTDEQIILGMIGLTLLSVLRSQTTLLPEC